MTIWQLYHSFFPTIFEPSHFKLCFLYIFFPQDLFKLIIIISNLVLLINSHHCFRQQKEKCCKFLKKQTKTKEANRKHSEIPTVRGVQEKTGGEGWGGHLGSCSLRTYLQQKGQGFWWWKWGSGWGKVHLHRSTGLRSWTARDRRSGARGVSLLHPQLSLRECSSPHHSLSRKRKRKKKKKATQCTLSNRS